MTSICWASSHLCEEWSLYHGEMNAFKCPAGRGERLPLTPLTFLEDSSGGDWLFHSSTDETEKSGEHSGLFRAQVGHCVWGWWTIAPLCSHRGGGPRSRWRLKQLAERDRIGWTLRKEMEVDGGRREEDEGRNPIWIKGLLGRISRKTSMILHISEGCTSSNVWLFEISVLVEIPSGCRRQNTRIT